MGKAVIADNKSLKVNRNIAGATTVGADCCAIVEYYMSDVDLVPSHHDPSFATQIITRHFGPGHAIPSSFNIYTSFGIGNAYTLSAAFTILSGVEFINSP